MEDVRSALSAPVWESARWAVVVFDQSGRVLGMPRFADRADAARAAFRLVGAEKARARDLEEARRGRLLSHQELRALPQVRAHVFDMGAAAL